MHKEGETPPDGSRYVLTPEARNLYLFVLAAGGTLESGQAAATDQVALEQLKAIGLLAYEVTDATYVAVDPQLLEARWGVSLYSDALRLITYASELPQQLRELSEAYRDGRRPSGAHRSTRYVQGKPAIREQIAQLLSASTEEVITVQPGALRTPDTVEVSVRNELPLLRRGVARRTIYQSATRHDPTVRTIARLITEAGGHIRTLGEPLERVFIIDRSTVVMAVAGDTNIAAFTQDPATVAYVLAGFERDWARADPFDETAPPPAELASKTQRTIVRLLVEGMGQQTIANRLGLSQRTVAGHIARIREHYGARTLFQLAWRIGREDGRHDTTAARPRTDSRPQG